MSYRNRLIRERLRRVAYSWNNLKQGYTNWPRALNDALKEIHEIRIALLFGGVAIVLAEVGLVNILERVGLDEFLRLKVVVPLSLGLLTFYVVWIGLWAFNCVRIALVRRELERLFAPAVFPETGDIREKTFEYLVYKVAALIETYNARAGFKPLTEVRLISPLNECTVKESQMLADLSRRYKLRFEWAITEQTQIEQRSDCRASLVDFIANSVGDSTCAYLTGELPVFDKLVVVPNVAIIAFVKHNWFSLNLGGLDVQMTDVKEKILLTPFPEKINQFFGKAEVHRAISCHLSQVVSEQGFMIDAVHSFLWIEKPDELFERFCDYQRAINEKFEAVTDRLRPKSTRITANLPLMENYVSIIHDSKVREWLGELKDEAISRKRRGMRHPKLIVDRYIYIQGKLVDAGWSVDAEYRAEVCNFLREPFFEDLPNNYNVRVVLFDLQKMKELYRNYKLSTDVKYPFDEIVSNWIWFENEDGYHVLQYEKALKVDHRVARALALLSECESKRNAMAEAVSRTAGVLNKHESDFSKISVFMFADAVDLTSQKVMGVYLDHKRFLEYCSSDALVMPHKEFLSRYCDCTPAGRVTESGQRTNEELSVDLSSTIPSPD